MKNVCDIAIFFAGGSNNGMIFHNVDIEELEDALMASPTYPFYSLLEDDGNYCEINLSRVEFIRVKAKK